MFTQYVHILYKQHYIPFLLTVLQSADGEVRTSFADSYSLCIDHYPIPSEGIQPGDVDHKLVCSDIHLGTVGGGEREGVISNDPVGEFRLLPLNDSIGGSDLSEGDVPRSSRG